MYFIIFDYVALTTDSQPKATGAHAPKQPAYTKNNYISERNTNKTTVGSK